MNKKIVYSCVLALALTACSQIPKEAYFNRGEPESLLDVNSEVVNLKIESPSSVREITHWINQDQPTRAELNCPESEKNCKKVKNILHQFGVPVKYSSTSQNNVVLVYERIQARDCQNRYIDNMVNPYNLNHPSFGCSISVNSVQMVSDKHQFTNPPLMDSSEAIKGVQAVEDYHMPSAYTPAPIVDFQPEATPQAVSSGGSSR
jgi:hypothetical protein